MAARLVSGALPPAVSEILVAVLAGILVANLVPLPEAVAPGVRFAVQRVLRLGIVLLGARLSLEAVLAIGAGTLGLVLAAMALAFGVALLAGRAFGVPPRLRLLIGVGTAVCGNSAIVATAPVIRAEEREVSFAVATITLFGTLAVFVFPAVGLWLDLPDAVFGVWAGIAVNDTSQVVAAGSAYSEESRDIATVVKLVRNALMAPLIVAIAWYWNSSGGSAPAPPGALPPGPPGSLEAPPPPPGSPKLLRHSIVSAVPVFVLGFLGMAALRTAGAITDEQAARLDQAATALILVALAGVGLNTRLAQMRTAGLTPFYVGLATAATLALVSLAAILALGIAPDA